MAWQLKAEVWSDIDLFKTKHHHLWDCVPLDNWSSLSEPQFPHL